MATRIYHCRPLLIAHETDGIIFHGEMDVEFTPSQPDETRGRAICTRPAIEQWIPHLNVEQRFQTLKLQDPDIRSRAGMTLIGVDDEDNEFAWYIDKSADDFFLAWKDGKLPEVENP